MPDIGGAADQSKRYRDIGFACGLEIHQRLATDGKLFCSCSTDMRKERLVGSVRRQQRAVSGEIGGIDLATEFEGMKNRDFVYEIFETGTCLMDIDEEPPHPINRQALETSLAIGKAFNMRFFDELQPMRKGVVDGSDPSAFQRTILIGVGGHLEVNGRKIGIELMSLEEESSGIKSSSGSEAVYTTERLGIPLIEIDTDATISSAQEAKEVALKIGTLLRLTGAVQRGIGSIRQDLNVSIKGGARVEVKGLQELDLMDRFVDMEILRQQKLIEIRDALVRNKAEVGEPMEVGDTFRHSKIAIINDQLTKKGAAFAFKLEGFAGLLGVEVNPGRRLGTEISDYAKTAGVGGIIHSDEDLAKYGFTELDIEAIREKLGIKILDKKSAFIIIAGPTAVAKRAAGVACDRARQAMVGVPRETRAVLNVDNCTTKFMRPIAGGSRMYPETDLMPVPITKEMLKAAEEQAPNMEREEKLLMSQLKSKDLAARMITSPRLPLYRFVIKSSKSDPEFVANILLQKFTELRRAGFETDSISKESVCDLFAAYDNRKITKQGIDEVIKALSKGEEDVQEITRRYRLERASGKALEKMIEAESKALGPGAPRELLIKQLMSKHRLIVDGQELNEMLSKRQ